ncbi:MULTISPECIES: hypothetical protein [Nostocales]|uniref:Phosphatidic acid phosphatase type 2/haloperoxidase domain-containing protein n=3 Tax=Nostocales TaxID=1161 RepID=A0A8S9SYF0_9CYAN|nr:hypothetical protein [Tolypothrix bouteillei]KAF3884283.1 hypothetical protein DA73_0400001355 [Tolypothrix bouteillei VB521301]
MSAFFTKAMLENARSRIYLGIHYQFDSDEGMKAGIRIADYVFDQKNGMQAPSF